ncbi:zinc finger B-box domain-containing protein 1 [Pelodytes ibericus]
MNTDFGIPLAKGGSSVKLKVKNVRELHVENIQLEMQNQEMEQKLSQLRHNMSKQKEERERSNGYHWKSGQAGNPNQDKENTVKISSGRIKFKVLKDPMPEPGKLKTVPISATTTVNEKPKIKGKACGQCETKSALLICLECGEDYCSTCFARIHQKGALKLHRSTPIQGKFQNSKLDVSREPKKALNCEESRERLDSDKGITSNLVSTGISSTAFKQDSNEKVFSSTSRKPVSDSRGLFHGMFNEEESAKSFADALMEWRNESRIQKSHPVSGMERVFRTPVNQVPSTLLDKRGYSSTSLSKNELNDYDCLTAEEMEEHEHYIALFKPQNNIRNSMTHEPALTIVELDKAPEEDLEESRCCSVTEVEPKELSIQESFPDTENKKISPICATPSDTTPIQAFKKGRDIPLRSTYSVGIKNILQSTEDAMVISTKGTKAGEHTFPIFTTRVSLLPVSVSCISFIPHPSLKLKDLLTASLLEDSKSIEYKSSNDNWSLDTALSVKPMKDFESIALKGSNKTVQYHGFDGFFVLGVDTKDIKPAYRPSQTHEQREEDSMSMIISRGKPPRIAARILGMKTKDGGLGFPLIGQFYEASMLLHLVKTQLPQAKQETWYKIEVELLGGKDMSSIIWSVKHKKYPTSMKNKSVIIDEIMPNWFSLKRKANIENNIFGTQKLNVLEAILEDLSLGDWENAGIQNISDLYQEGQMLTMPEMRDKYNLPNLNVFRYLRVKSCLLKNLKEINNDFLRRLSKLIIKDTNRRLYSKCLGYHSYWRPETSLSDCADYTIVNDIVEKAQTNYLNNNTKNSFSPRHYTPRAMKRPLTGDRSGTPYSISYTRQNSCQFLRPNTATSRPLSRAASEISEIEFIDSMEKDDHLSEHAQEQETLTVLGKELDTLSFRSAKLKTVVLIKEPIKLAFFRLLEYPEHQYLWVRLQVQNSQKQRTFFRNSSVCSCSEACEKLKILYKAVYFLHRTVSNQNRKRNSMSHEPFQDGRQSKYLKPNQTMNRSPMHSVESRQSYNGESDSNEDEETLQDKLHVLSLQ